MNFAGIEADQIGQTAAKAIQFYEEKVKGLDASLQDLEKIVQGKSASLNAVEEGEFLFCLFVQLVNWC